MKVFKHVKSFIFNKASYELSDGNGNEALVKIDYKNKEFEINTNGLVNGEKAQLKREAVGIAKDLLKRKSGVNFAENLTF